MSPLRRSLLALAAVPVLLAPAGCARLGLGGPSGDVLLESAGESGARLDVDYPIVLHDAADPNSAVVLLTNLPESVLLDGEGPLGSGTVLCIRMFWAPKAGNTPIDRTATNCTIRQIVLVGNEDFGIYGGAGFIQPAGEPGSGTWRAEIRDSNLRLDEVLRTDGFRDRLGTAVLRGSFAAEHAPDDAVRIAARVNADLSRRLGEPVFVIPVLD